MEPEKVKIGLERFYAGETSAEEEASLKAFFSGTGVPEELAAEKEHFRMLMQWQSENPLDETFDNRIMEQIVAPAKRERIFTGWYALAGVAASILLVLALWLGNHQDKKSVLPGTTTNPALAYVQARNALQLVSGTLNEGVRPASETVAEMTGALHKVAEISALNAAVKPVQKLSEMERARRLMESLNRAYVNLEPVKK